MCSNDGIWWNHWCIRNVLVGCVLAILCLYVQYTYTVQYWTFRNERKHCLCALLHAVCCIGLYALQRGHFRNKLLYVFWICSLNDASHPCVCITLQPHISHSASLVSCILNFSAIAASQMAVARLQLIWVSVMYGMEGSILSSLMG